MPNTNHSKFDKPAGQTLKAKMLQHFFLYIYVVRALFMSNSPSSTLFRHELRILPFFKQKMMIESSLGDMLMKVGMFVLVQALVYLILSKSSNIFSKTQKRSTSFKTARSVSIRRILAALQDLPAGGELSPSPKNMQSPTVEKPSLPKTS